MQRFWRGVMAVLLACAAAVPATAGELAPTATLRATFLAANPVQGTVDPATGEVRGPAADLGRELARRLGVSFSITGVGGVQAVIDSVKTGAADIGFIAFDPVRAVEVDFSQPYLLAYNTYLVSAGSPIRTAADADQPGVRIGVGQGDAADLFLSRTLKHAELRRNPGGSIAVALRMLAEAEIGAYAANRVRLLEAVSQRADLRLLPDNFLAVEQAIVVAKGEVSRLAIVNRLIEDARASGLIRAAIDRAKLNGVDVAPPRTEEGGPAPSRQ
jgi:ABC-type amino acid transport substrate-binding protein